MSDLHCQNLSFAYPGSKRVVLKSIDLTIRRGEIVLLAGPSGCGKSTLAMALAGLIPARVPGRIRGHVRYGEKVLSQLDIHEVSQHIGMVFQNPDNQIIHLDVESEVAFGPENLGLPREEVSRRVGQSLQATGISHLRKSEVYTLSGGQKQRVAIAATLAMHPDVLVLDEPTSDLDPVGTQEVLSVLRHLNEQYGMTIVLVEHKIDEVIPFVDRVVLLNQGEVVLDEAPRQSFHNIEAWQTLGVAVPEVVQVAHAFPEVFSNRLPLTVEEAVDAFWGTRYVNAFRQFGSITEQRETQAGGSSPLFEWRHVGLQFGTHRVLKDVSLPLAPKSWVALVGANGSGKTSLASLAMGFQEATEGQMMYGEQLVRAGKVSLQAREIAYLFQAADNMLFAPTVKGELQFGYQHTRKQYRRESLTDTFGQVLGATRLTDYVQMNPFHLSHGQRKRLAIGALLMRWPKMMILDEPTTGQDEGHAKAFLAFLKQLQATFGLTYLMITHDMRAVANYADQLAVLHNGEIRYSGLPSQVFANVDGLAECKIVPPPMAKLHALLSAGEAKQVCLTPDEFIQVAQQQEVMA